jgi:hypothetical protein
MYSYNTISSFREIAIFQETESSAGTAVINSNLAKKTGNLLR